ncbi:MAG: type II secretion system protein N [Burkholderiales bacterium]
MPAVRFPSFRYLFGAIGLYVLFLVVTAPAWLAVWALPKFAPFPIAVEDSRGSLWRGEFSGVSATLPTGQKVEFDRVQWRLQPWRLLRAELAAAVEFSGAQLQGKGIFGKAVIGGVKLRELNVAAPASLLPIAMPALEIWKPGGTLEMSTAEFIYAGTDSTGKASITWKQAALALSSVKPLGEYSLAVDANDSGLNYQLTTISGALQLEGKGRWAANSAPTFLGSARAQPNYAVQLADLLRLLGTPDSSGTVPLRYQPAAAVQ